MSSDTPALLAERRKSPLERLLGLAADVRAGEGATGILLALNGFLLLASYYAIRPLRSALQPVVLELPGGAVLRGPEIGSYSGAILAALFLFIVPLWRARQPVHTDQTAQLGDVVLHRDVARFLCDHREPGVLAWPASHSFCGSACST